MAVNKKKNNVGYGLSNALQDLAPQPIVATRNPGTSDKAELGTTWINKSSNAVYVLTSVAGSSTWTGVASTGGPFTDLTITGAAATDVFTIDEGNAVITAGDLTLSSGNLEVSGDLNVTGDISFTGDFDVTDTASISLTSTNNAADAIYLRANGGTSETIRIHSDQGTGVASVALVSDVGGISLTSGLASDDAINLTASSGGVDIDGALQVNIASSENAADAIVISASAGGIDISATGSAGEDIDIVNTGGSVNISATENAASAITITSNGGTSETIVVTNTQGTGAAAISLAASAGGITLDGALATADAINIVASDAAGGIDVDAGTGGIAVDTTGAYSLDGAAASNVSVSGAGIDLSLESAEGRVIINGEEAAANAITLLSAAGGIDADAALQINIDSSQAAAADSVRIVASAADGGMDLDSGTGGTTIDSTGAVSIDAAAASNFSVSGAGIDLTLASAAGRVVVNGEEAATDAVRIVSAAGGLDVDTALELNLTSSEASVADAVTISASHAAGGITLDAGVTPGVTFTNGTQSHQMLVGSGSPNGSVTASQGSLYVDVAGSTSTTILYANTDGGTTWLGVGA